MRLIYTTAIYIYTLLIHFAANFNRKAKKMVDGRKSWEKKLEAFKKEYPGKRIWIHCASLGEYEMALPLIEGMRKSSSEDLAFMISFFSPSGFEPMKNTEEVEGVIYLPFDTRVNSKRFIKLLDPSMFFLVKYDFWFNYLFELKNKGIPLYLINAHFRADQFIMKSRSDFFRSHLTYFKHIFVQYEASKKILGDIGLDNVSVTGDLRFDRVSSIDQDSLDKSDLLKFIDGDRVLIAGSSWPEEESLLAENEEHLRNYKLIVVPHDISSSHLRSIESKFGKEKTVRWSNLEAGFANKTVLIVDSIGMLSRLYPLADLAVVGGGYSGKLHNILEAAIQGIPVIIGPKFERFPEAQILIDQDIVFSVNNSDDLRAVLQSGKLQIGREETKIIRKEFVLNMTGAGQRILAKIELE